MPLAINFDALINYIEAFAEAKLRYRHCFAKLCPISQGLHIHVHPQIWVPLTSKPKTMFHLISACFLYAILFVFGIYIGSVVA